MDIEIISEDEVVYSRRKKEVINTDTLYERTFGNRTYWDKNGDDVKLQFLLAKQKINRENRKGRVVDIENDDYFRMLFPDQIEMLRNYQKDNMQYGVL